MKIQLCFAALAMFTMGVLAAPLNADSNASGGNVVNSQDFDFGAGPFNHGAAVGDLGNSVATASFAGGFTANRVRFIGDLESQIAGTFASEADIQIRFGVDSFNWQNPGGTTFTNISYDDSQDITGSFSGGIDPNGTWDVEFYDSINDGDGADSLSSNVIMRFEENDLADTSGNFSLGSIGNGDSANSVGEFAFSALFDLYTITLNEAGSFRFSTDADPTGFVGSNVDTEIAIFDSVGNLVDNDDDGGAGTFSSLVLDLDAGEYTLAVGGYNTAFADGFSVTPGNATGDYSLSASLIAPVPEPTSLALLGLVCLGVIGSRRRKS